MQLEPRTDDDDRTAGVIDALAEQVAAETPLLAFEHVAERLEFAPAAAAERLTALAVVDQAVHSFLKHALLVAHDHVRRTEVKQVVQAVIAIDHAAVEVVQVAGGEASAVKLHHRAQIGWDDRQDGQDHPFGAVVALAQAFDDAQPLGRLLFALLAARRAHLVPQLFGHTVEVDIRQDLVEGFRAHIGLKDVAVARLQLAIAVFGKELEHMQLLQIAARTLSAGANARHALF